MQWCISKPIRGLKRSRSDSSEEKASGASGGEAETPEAEVEATGRWRVEIARAGKKHQIGYFDDEEEAHRARVKAEELLDKDPGWKPPKFWWRDFGQALSSGVDAPPPSAGTPPGQPVQCLRVGLSGIDEPCGCGPGAACAVCCAQRMRDSAQPSSQDAQQRQQHQQRLAKRPKHEAD